MKKITRLLLRILKITGIALASVILLLFLAPYLFPGTVDKQIKQWTNQSIKGELNFTKARLSFFTHFPSLTLTLYDVDLKGSAPYQQDTLLSAAKLGFGVNLKKLLFDHQVSINKIFLTGAYIHVLVNEKGQANYNIYVSDTTNTASNTDTSAASLHLEKIVIKDSRLFYNDLSVPMSIQAEHLYYEGTGDLSQSVFDLTSHIKTDSLNFTFDKLSYVRRKAVDAQLITHINTKTLALLFENNQLKINKLNIAFTGKLDFLKNGYDMDFNVASKEADLYQLITIFPPEYLDWLRETTVKGNVDLKVALKGKYIASTKEMPDFSLSLALRDGFISYQNALLPVSQLNAMASVELPSLDQEKMHLKIDSFNFHLDKDYFWGQVETRGLSDPSIKAKIDAQLNLQNLKKAMGIKVLDMQGLMNLHLNADGRYAKKIIRTSLRKTDTVIASIPAFNIKCSLKNGFLKYYKVASPVENIFLEMEAACKDSNYKNAYFNIDTLHAAALKNYIEGRGIIHASTNYPLDMNFNGVINLAEIKQVYPMDSLSLAGNLKFDIQSKGKYAPEHHLFPGTNAHFTLQDGYVQTKYYPHPIEKMNIDARASDANGTLNGLHLIIQPASILFEGKPFQFTGDFRNFDDLKYDISAKGELDLGKIYQVFARHDINVSGYLRANVKFKGTQSDAQNGRYAQLQNSGTLDVRDLRVSHEWFPQPFLIHRGHFRFDQDKMWFETFQASYGKSDLTLDGFAENVINYALSNSETLKANFNLKASNIDLNEFSVYADPSSGKTETTADAGVILVPTTLDLTIKADAEKVIYNDITLNHFTGGVNIKDGVVELTQTGFEMIGCQVKMDGKYAALNPTRANFEYHLQATDFDVQRAYKEVKLFHDLASSAEHAYGIISIDYSLSGKLDQTMYPIYPSLKGSGVLSVKNVKFNGWKLFNTVSSASGKTELKDPNLSKIDVKSSIKNNLITIERLKFKTSGFRIRFEGQTSFDKKVNFKMRIGLPPLGIIGIPIRVTGDAMNPKIKLGSSDTDPLQEKEDN